jgi:hypothetical protein
MIVQKTCILGLWLYPARPPLGGNFAANRYRSPSIARSEGHSPFVTVLPPIGQFQTRLNSSSFHLPGSIVNVVIGCRLSDQAVPFLDPARVMPIPWAILWPVPL